MLCVLQKAKQNIQFGFLFLKVSKKENWKRSRIIQRISYHIVASDEFDQLWKNYANSMGNEHISLKYCVKTYEFFIVLENCGRQESFNTV